MRVETRLELDKRATLGRTGRFDVSSWFTNTPKRSNVPPEELSAMSQSRPRSLTDTHEVTNQPESRGDIDLWASDPALRDPAALAEDQADGYV